jgi:hypothetical protein
MLMLQWPIDGGDRDRQPNWPRVGLMRWLDVHAHAFDSGWAFASA